MQNVENQVVNTLKDLEMSFEAKFIKLIKSYKVNGYLVSKDNKMDLVNYNNLKEICEHLNVNTKEIETKILNF